MSGEDAFQSMIGRQLGPYSVVSLLAKGGMGEVYRARDTQLHRDVALKVLPSVFASDADRLARFQREAQVLAALNHPNIAQIYGLEGTGASRCIVMELVEGDTLQERLKRGAIPVEEALPIARQIAEALEAAHERGIVHRDLKPANVKLTPGGKVKVLDFGLAKAFQREPATTLSNSPTLVEASVPGVILGTAAYMSPEQAKGKETDHRTDVWAYGCVLYEMLAGRPAFEGETVSEILAGIFKVEPDWKRLPVDTPAPIRRLLRRCLDKDPRERLQHIGDARIEMKEATSAADVEGDLKPGAAQRNQRLVWILALASAMLVAALWGVSTLRSTRPVREVRLEINTPPAAADDLGVSFAILPDGRKIVFAATVEGRSQLWLRPLDSESAHPLAGTEGGIYPFWSPDSQSIGFFADGQLKRIDIAGGAAQTLANAPLGRGGAWNREGVILFTPSNSGPISRVSAAGGGQPVEVTRMPAGQQRSHRFAQFLPDNRHFLYLVQPEDDGIYVGQLDGSDTRRIMDADSAAVYTSGQLLFVRGGTLFAQSFDPAQLTLTGTPAPIAERVSVHPGLSAAGAAGAIAVSTNSAGAIVYRSASATGQRQFIWFERSGKEIEKVEDPPSDGSSPSLSLDGQRLALHRTVNGNTDIWLLETRRGLLSRFTFDPAGDIFPIWSPDGSRIVFGSVRSGGVYNLYQKPATGAANEELLLATPQHKSATDWSPDGRFILYRSPNAKTSFDIWALPMTGDGKPFPVVQTNFEERDAQFSPDGKRIAYQSNKSGRFEIYVQPFPGPGSETQISTNGGAQVRWRRDGKELFYIALDGRLMAVPIASTGDALEAGTPAPLFVTRVGGAVQFDRQQYVVSPDGQRFLMNTVVADVNVSPLTVILNWSPQTKK